eukprot:1312246-Pyramimonas_sp.AAC.1
MVSTVSDGRGRSSNARYLSGQQRLPPHTGSAFQCSVKRRFINADGDSLVGRFKPRYYKGAWLETSEHRRAPQNLEDAEISCENQIFRVRRWIPEIQREGVAFVGFRHVVFSVHFNGD